MSLLFAINLNQVLPADFHVFYGDPVFASQFLTQLKISEIINSFDGCKTEIKNKHRFSNVNVTF